MRLMGLKSIGQQGPVPSGGVKGESYLFLASTRGCWQSVALAQHSTLSFCGQSLAFSDLDSSLIRMLVIAWGPPRQSRSISPYQEP